MYQYQTANSTENMQVKQLPTVPALRKHKTWATPQGKLFRCPDPTASRSGKCLVATSALLAHRDTYRHTPLSYPRIHRIDLITHDHTRNPRPDHTPPWEDARTSRMPAVPADRERIGPRGFEVVPVSRNQAIGGMSVRRIVSGSGVGSAHMVMQV